jgi:hypothetical protein
VPAAGVEYYLPLFFDQLATVFDYCLQRDADPAPRCVRRGAGFLAGRTVALPRCWAATRTAAAAARATVPARRGVFTPAPGFAVSTFSNRPRWTREQPLASARTCRPFAVERLRARESARRA